MEQLHCTALERILIHLLDYLKNERLPKVPLAVTQEGIASIVCIKRKHVPRSLKKLIDHHYVFEQRNHVTGKKQMMKTYFLTSNGRFEALRIKNQLADQLVHVIIKGEKTEKSIQDIFEMYNKKFSYACIVSQVIKQSFFDEDHLFCYDTRREKDPPISAEQIYKNALEEAWKDGVLTVDERNILKKLRDTLHISEETHYRIQHSILQSKQLSSNETYRQIYDIILTEILKDDKISKDEQAILKKLKKHFNIPDEESTS